MPMKQIKTHETFEKVLAKKNIAYTFRVGHIKAAPADLARVLGKGCTSDKYKSSRDYFFSFNGEPVTLYDWKSTSLYEDRLPKPKDFWAQTTPVVFNVGGVTEIYRNQPALLVQYLHSLGCPASLYFYETDSTFSLVGG